jgi:hypothetical protein
MNSRFDSRSETVCQNEDTDDSQPDEAVTMSTPRWNIGGQTKRIKNTMCAVDDGVTI